MQMNAEQVILSRGLPKTGQTTGRAASDDGYVEAGWWQGLKNYNNKTRFIAKTLGGDDVVIDLATGLMWAADAEEQGCNYNSSFTFTECCLAGADLIFAGFDDWRLPNVRELASLINFKKRTPAINQPPFANTKSSRYWSSTTQEAAVSYAWDVDFADGIVWYDLKSTTRYMRCVRGGV